MNPPGISITSHAPLWRSIQWTVNPDSWHLTDQITKYEHVIEALGGFWSCKFTIRANRHMMDDWIQDGLGRHIEVYDDTLTCIWEGFVNKLTVNYGPLAAVRGPLLDVANWVDVTYTTVEYDEDDNPVMGTTDTTTQAEDADSQGLWGLLPRRLSVGRNLLADAEQIRNAYLENHKDPNTSKEWRSDSRTDTSVVVECLGYVHWFNWIYTPYNAGDQDASEKIEHVIARNPNIAWLPFSIEHVTENTLQVPAWEDGENISWSVIKDVVARGDASLGRWLFGIYANLEAYYEAAPTDVEYQQRLSQPKPRIERTYGDQVDEVYPWKVMPGKWLMFPDFLIGQAAELDLKDDPRAMFIERVKFTAPETLELKGGTVDSVDALIAQYGLSGIGS